MGSVALVYWLGMMKETRYVPLPLSSAATGLVIAILAEAGCDDISSVTARGRDSSVSSGPRGWHAAFTAAAPGLVMATFVLCELSGA